MKSPQNDGQLQSQLSSQQQLTPEATAPTPQLLDPTWVYPSPDSKTAQDPAPTTLCERGLGPESREVSQPSRISEKAWGRSEISTQWVLQKRDREILRVCYEQQFLLSEQVGRFFYPGKNRSNGFVRIQELEKMGMLRRVMNPNLDGKSLIRVTRAGLRAIADDLVLEVPQVRKPDVRTLRHDACVTTVRLRLGELWNGSWLPERVLKQEDCPQIPDGIFIFPSGKKVAIEVENSLKPKARLLGLFERWRRVDVTLVLYVATSPSLFSHLQRCLREGPRAVPLALVGLDELCSGVPLVWTCDGEVGVFSVREY